MYRSPGGSLDSFNSFLQDFLHHIGNKLYILCGDLNINLLNSGNHKLTQDFVDILSGFGLYSLINLSTRVTLDSATLIDNMIY